MGVSRKEYVMVGYDLSRVINRLSIDGLDDWLEDMEELNEVEGYEFVFDGMSGEYCFVGYVLDKGDVYEGLNTKKNRIRDLEYIAENVEDVLKDKLVVKMPFFKISQFPCLITFSHWY